MGLTDILKGVLKGRESTGGDQWQKCPSCSEQVNLSMERCPKCGVHLSSMFRRKCPKCETLNELDKKKCVNCNYSFEAEFERAKKTSFQCPICSYKSDVYLTSCPVCNTRFI